MVRRLRVLSQHPQLGDSGHVVEEFDGAQAFVDAGLAEWIADPVETAETAEAALPMETAVTRESVRARAKPRLRQQPERDA